MAKMRAVQATRPKAGLEIVERPVPEPGPGEVRVRVEACGVCHSDAMTVEGHWPGIQYPRVPGHEIAGAVDAIGAGVTGFTVGGRVGVGWHGGHCGVCDPCRRGDYLTCRVGKIPGISYDGGYAECMIAPAVALARLPERLSAIEAAPLMCAGITVFNSLRHSGARPGDVVAVLGLGGLGHLAVQYAAKAGYVTVGIARGRDKGPLARKLGAHHYIDNQAGDPGAELQKLGGAQVILATVTSGKAMSAVLGGLAVGGRLVVLGAAADPIEVPPIVLIGARRSIAGWPSGTSIDSEDTLAFSVAAGVRSMNEVFPLARAPEGYARMMSGEARFRVVLDMRG